MAKTSTIIAVTVVVTVIVFSLLVFLVILPYYSSTTGGYYSSSGGSQPNQQPNNVPITNTIVQNDAVNEPAGGAAVISFPVYHSGYIIVDVETSTTTNTWVQIVENDTSAGNVASQQYSVGDSGTVNFPVLPGYVYVYIGNSNLFNGASETVTIMCVYNS